MLLIIDANFFLQHRLELSMLQKSESAGQQYLAGALIGTFLFCLCAILPAYGWGNAERSPEDPDAKAAHPHYNDILAGKIARDRLDFGNSEDSLFAAALNSREESPLALRIEPGNAGSQPLGTRFSAGWEMPLSDAFSTGPVAQYAVDSGALNCQQCVFSDRLPPDQIASVGWRIDSWLGWVMPWAQLSYSHQLGSGITEQNARSSALSPPREDNWLDISVGAHMPINNNMAAFASFSQTGAANSGEQFIYSLGVSASF